MKSLTEIKSELIIEGAKQRLIELNHERDTLLKILNHKDEKAKKIIETVKKKKHWMQLPKNRAKMMKRIKEMHIAKANKTNRSK